MKRLFLFTAALLALSLQAISAPLLHWKFDESSGLIATDSSGNDLNGAWEGTAGAPNWNPSGGVSGGSVIFSGTNGESFINEPFSAITEMPATASAWIKTTSSNKNGIVYLGDGATGDSYYLVGIGSGRARVVARNTVEQIGETVSNINDGEWHHVVGVYESSTLRHLYLDGVYQTTSTDEVADLLPTRFGVGALTRNTPHVPVDLFNGEIDDVALWGRLFSAADSAALHGLGVLGAGDASHLDDLMDAYLAQTSVSIEGREWEYATGLVGPIGTTGGSVALRTAFIVLDGTGKGMQMAALPGNPILNDFSALPLVVFLGESSTLSWDVGNATSLVIDNGVGAVGNHSGTQEVTPTETTTYTLTASNGNGSTMGEATVTVLVDPVINSFTGSSLGIFEGEEVTLSWNVENFNSLEIDQGIGVVAGPTGMLGVSPTTNTTYILTATNDTSSVTAEVDVAVYPAPPPRELLLHWPLDEGDGAVSADLAGENPGVFDEQGGVITWSVGHIGAGALTFPNIDGVSVRALTQLVDSYPFTMCGWVNTTASENDTFAVLATGQPFQYYSMRVGGGAALLTTRNNGFFDQSGPSVNDGEWHFVTGVFAHRESMSLYVDGVFVAERTTDSGDFVLPDRFAIGALDRTDTSVVDPFGGSVDDVSFWRGVLSGNEIAALNGAANLGLNASDMAAIFNGFESDTTVRAAGQNWRRVFDLTGEVGTTAGSLLEGNATIVLDGSGNGMAAGPGGFTITEISRDATGTTLEWESVPGVVYVVEFSTDLVDWSEEVDDNVVSGGATTTFKDSDPGRLALPTGFYRVVR